MVKASKIADLSVWPRDWESLAAYGDEHIETILTHYDTVLLNAAIEVDKVEMEWPSLKRAMMEDKYIGCSDWVLVHKRYGTRFPNILHVMDLQTNNVAIYSPGRTRFLANEIDQDQPEEQA